MGHQGKKLETGTTAGFIANFPSYFGNNVAIHRKILIDICDRLCEKVRCRAHNDFSV